MALPCHRIGPDPAAVAGELALLPVLRDNLVPILHNGSQAVVVDPAVAEPVAGWLQARGLELVAILHTHHHSDHIGGTPGLLRHWPDAAVVAAAEDRPRIPLQTLGVGEGDHLELLGRRLAVLAVPGHTLQHLAYLLEPLEGQEGGDLFCGDSLFAAGCGRMFEGSPEQMHASLQRLAALDPATRVWCAHEYTEANLRWAVAVAPDDGAIRLRLETVQQQRRAGGCTIPSSIALERRTNLMLQAPDPASFAVLRRHKDGFRG
ncbi:MAG: hydroxyacylglutathione hydrolase [Cyanobacteriota bacterium]